MEPYFGEYHYFWKNGSMDVNQPNNQRLASASLPILIETERRIKDTAAPFFEVQVQETGEILRLPLRALEVLRHTIYEIAVQEQRSSSREFLSEVETARILNVAEGKIPELIEEGSLYPRYVDHQRQFLLSEVVGLRRQLRAQGDEAMDELLRQSREWGTYD